jgi:hypothetical protein
MLKSSIFKWFEAPSRIIEREKRVFARSKGWERKV